MGMNLAVAGVDHEPFKIWFIDQYFQQSFPYAIVAPADKATMRIAPTAEIGRQIPPRRTRSRNPKDCIYKQAVILGNTAPTPFASRQVRLKFFPNSIRNVVSSMGWLRHASSLVVKDKETMTQNQNLDNLVTTLSKPIGGQAPGS